MKVAVVAWAHQGEPFQIGPTTVCEVGVVMRFGTCPVLITLRVHTSLVAYREGELLQRRGETPVTSEVEDPPLRIAHTRKQLRPSRQAEGIGQWHRPQPYDLSVQRRCVDHNDHRRFTPTSAGLFTARTAATGECDERDEGIGETPRIRLRIRKPAECLGAFGMRSAPRGIRDRGEPIVELFALDRWEHRPQPDTAMLGLEERDAPRLTLAFGVRHDYAA